jgi:glycosyltransferase involved in cell wall biosynthesis
LIINGFPEEQIVVLPNVASARDSRRDPDVGQYVAYLGRISPEKGINVALEAARRTGLPLFLAGDFNAMPEIVESTPESVKFIGRLNREDIDKFYSKARFAIVPSIWYETFGIVIVEAMANGLPVIGSNIGGIPEIIEHGKTGFLVKPGDPDDLANKMRLLWDNPDLCRRMGEAGREKAVREYSEEVYYKKLMDIYEHAMLIHGKHDPNDQAFEGASSSHQCC